LQQQQQQQQQKQATVFVNDMPAGLHHINSCNRWCLTVEVILDLFKAAHLRCCLQEASLYLPYPLELLGFPSFGVQLDAAGRLLFGGPRYAVITR
jgi:hypothetical protein